ncbi:MAG: tetratricopeptide repeat protein [Candidatus Omnitrophica bacterium]|nr:tetratricopeptide repeat protein [Candidatus Omnitrophota bacterium]
MEKWRTLHNLAQDFAQKKDYLHAIQLYSEALNLSVNNNQILNGRGIAYWKIGNHQEAINDFSKIISNDANYYKAYFNRSGVHLSNGKTTEALEDINTAIKISPNYPKAILRRAWINKILHQTDAALIDLCYLIEQKDGEYSKKAYWTRGQIFIEKAIEDRDATSDAATHNDKSIKNHPEHYEIGQLFLLNNDYFLLAQIDAHSFSLLSLTSGRMWCPPESAPNIKKIAVERIEEITDGYELIPVREDEKNKIMGELKKLRVMVINKEIESDPEHRYFHRWQNESYSPERQYQGYDRGFGVRDNDITDYNIDGEPHQSY